MSDCIKYSVRPTKVQNSVAVICYALPDDRGVSRLLSIAWNGEAADYFKQATMREIPPTITYEAGKTPREMYMWVSVGCEIRDVSNIDLSFEKFWQVYGSKMGNKNDCKTKWNKLEITEKMLALGAIPRMQKYHTGRGIGIPFPETYLNQRRWENLFE